MMTNESRFPVVDSRAPRTNQAFASGLVLAGWLLDQPWVLAATAFMLWVGVGAGRRWIPAYQFYFGVLQPRFGDGKIEDDRAPTFAQAMGATGLFAAFVCIQAGAPVVGWGIALSLAAAAAFAAVTGICLGCWTYRLLAMARRIRPLRVEQIDPHEVGLRGGNGRAIVGFSHPLCHECRIWEERLASGSRPFVTVDVRERPEIARRYGISLLPSVFEVEADGTVIRQLAP